MITVFTPTYNRAHTLPKLYESLERQECKDLEWLIVDDGSTDNTEEIIAEFKSSASFPMRYFKKENGGKHRAINYGVTLAQGDMFFIVDSDDWLTPDALSLIQKYSAQTENDAEIAGVCGLRKYPDGRINGLNEEFDVIDATTSEISKYLTCDKAEVFKTDILRQYPFPEFEGEKFISEGVVWRRISEKFKLRYFFMPIYVCDYLEDGLTKNIVKMHRQSPLGSLLLYKERYNSTRSMNKKFKSLLNYYRYAPNAESIPKDLRLPFYTLLFAPLGYILYLNDNL